MNKVTSFETFGLEVSFNLSQELLKDKNVTAVLEEYFIQSDRITSPLTEAILITIYIVMSLSAIVSNSLILKVILQTAKLYIPTYILLVNLMIADLALAIVCMPFTLIIFIRQSWPFGWLMCKIIPMTQGVAVLATSLTIAMIAADRCLRITSMKPVALNQVSRKNFSKNKLIIETCVIWIVPIIIALPQALYQEQVEIGIPGSYSFYKCVEKWPGNSRAIYSLCVLFIQLIVPSACLVISYFRIKMCLRRKFIRISESLVALNSFNNMNVANMASNSALKGTPSATAASRAIGDSTIIPTHVVRSNTDLCNNRLSNIGIKSDNYYSRNHKQLYVSKSECKSIIIDVVKISKSSFQRKSRKSPSIELNNDNETMSASPTSDVSSNSDDNIDMDVREKCSNNNDYHHNHRNHLKHQQQSGSQLNDETHVHSLNKSKKHRPKFIFDTIDLNLTALDNDTSFKPFKLTTNGKISPLSDIRADRVIREIYRNKRVTNTLLFVTATFALGWIPWNLINSYLDFSTQPVISADVIYSLMACCHILAMTSATVNAVLYGYTNCNIRRELRRFTSSSPSRSPSN